MIAANRRESIHGDARRAGTCRVAAALLLTLAALPAARADVYDMLVKKFDAETAQYRTAGQMVRPLLPDKLDAHAEFLAVARELEGTDDALPYLGWLLQNAPRNPEAHGYAVAQVDVLAQKRADELRASGADWEALGQASRKAVRHLKYNTVDGPAFARTLRDVKALALAAEMPGVRSAAEQSVFKLTRLQEGMVAPDIVGDDLDGMEFKLSDYRGKVVVIDFWGDW